MHELLNVEEHEKKLKGKRSRKNGFNGVGERHHDVKWLQEERMKAKHSERSQQETDRNFSVSQVVWH